MGRRGQLKSITMELMKACSKLQERSQSSAGRFQVGRRKGGLGSGSTSNLRTPSAVFVMGERPSFRACRCQPGSCRDQGIPYQYLRSESSIPYTGGLRTQYLAFQGTSYPRCWCLRMLGCYESHVTLEQGNAILSCWAPHLLMKMASKGTPGWESKPHADASLA